MIVTARAGAFRPPVVIIFFILTIPNLNQTVACWEIPLGKVGRNPRSFSPVLEQRSVLGVILSNVRG